MTGWVVRPKPVKRQPKGSSPSATAAKTAAALAPAVAANQKNRRLSNPPSSLASEKVTRKNSSSSRVTSNRSAKAGQENPSPHKIGRAQRRDRVWQKG